MFFTSAVGQLRKIRRAVEEGTAANREAREATP